MFVNINSFESSNNYVFNHVTKPNIYNLFIMIMLNLQNIYNIITFYLKYVILH
jgi:hypothetical protein